MFQFVILAAGEGKRMKQSLPKVLTPIKGQPMISYLIKAIESSKVSKDKISIVIGNGAEQVKQNLGDNYNFILQTEQLGTGHAVKVALDNPQVSKSKNIIVLYGDHAFLKPESISKLAKMHQDSGNTITLMTATVPDFDDWRVTFLEFGRIIRDSNSNDLLEIVERKDATDEQRQIKEVNPGYYCFSMEWLKDNIVNLKNENVQKEFYLTDLLKLAILSGEKIGSIDIEPIEALGINSPEQLSLAQNL